MTDKELLPVPLDPSSIQVSVAPCSGCTNGRRDIYGDDPDDFGIGGCCEGLGVTLQITPGCELLVFRLALIQAWAWAHGDERDPGDVRPGFFEDIEDELAKFGFVRRHAPHRAGARASADYRGSEEHRQDQEIARGSTLYEMDPDFA